MPGLSISYRRSDSEAITGRIFDRLIRHYGRKSVFRDVDNVPVGVDFRSHIQDVLQKSDVLIAVVGPDWRGSRSKGHARIDEENDQVRIEVETALKKGIPAIPVLVGRSEIPAPAELPESLKQFSYRNAVRVDTGQDFDHHVDRLIRETDGSLKGKKIGSRHYAVAGIAALALVLALGGWLYRRHSQNAYARTPWLAVADAEIGQEEIAGPEKNAEGPRLYRHRAEHARRSRRRNRLGLGLRRMVVEPGRPRRPAKHGANRVARLGPGYRRSRGRAA